MAPFYSTLSIWIGGIVLVAMLKVTVSKKTLDGLKNVKLHQIYLGRYLIFLIVGLFQSSLICLGDLFYLGIQCQHPFLFVLAGWISSIVYANMVRLRLVSFGDIGKAISVVLLVVPGRRNRRYLRSSGSDSSGGHIRSACVYSMAAEREAVGGGVYYGLLDGSQEACCLDCFTGCVGLVLRQPVIQNEIRFTERLEETKLI